MSILLSGSMSSSIPYPRAGGLLWHCVIKSMGRWEERGFMKLEVCMELVSVLTGIRMDWEIVGKGMAFVIGNGRREKF